MMPVEEPEQDWAKEQDMGTILRSSQLRDLG